MRNNSPPIMANLTANAFAPLGPMADEQLAAFLALVGKCLPRDIAVSTSEPIVIRWKGE